MATHVLDHSEIDELNVISGDEQYVLVWCERIKARMALGVSRPKCKQRRRSRPDGS